MRQSRFTEAQIVSVLHEWDAGAKTSDLVRRHGVTQQTLYRWRRSRDTDDRVELTLPAFLRELTGRLGASPDHGSCIQRA
jgi:putative transposase